MNDIRSLLDQVPGLDVAYGLKNLRGRIPNYLRLLRYVKSYKSYAFLNIFFNKIIYNKLG